MLLHESLPSQDLGCSLSSLLSFKSISQVSTIMRTLAMCAIELASPLLCHLLCGSYYLLCGSCCTAGDQAGVRELMISQLM